MLSVVVIMVGINLIVAELCVTAYKMYALFYRDKQNQRLSETDREMQSLSFRQSLLPLDSVVVERVQNSLKSNAKYPSLLIRDIETALEQRKLFVEATKNESLI